MGPPWVNGAARSSADTASEHASATACSAFCYHVSEDVWILTVVMTERELGQVQRQVGFTDLMERPDHATLEQAPERFDVVCMHVPSYILAFLMLHRFMWEFPAQATIAGKFIRGHQRDSFIHGMTHKLVQGDTIRALNHLADHITLASNRADYGRFTAAPRNPAALVRMAVLILATDVGLVYFDFAHQLAESAVPHGSTNAMAHIPGRPVVAAADLPMDLQGADPLLALRHEIDHLEPRPQRVVGILEHGLTDDGEAVTVPSTTLFAFADPVKWLALECVHFLILATRALHAIRPAFLNQELFAGFFGGELIHQFGECEWLGHRVPLGWADYSRDHDMVSSTT